MSFNKFLITLFSIIFFLSCSKTETENRNFVFVKKYCTTITVGGIIGIKEQCYEVGDEVIAELTSNNSITIRIANGPQIKDESGPWSFQELLEIPLEFVKLK